MALFYGDLMCLVSPFVMSRVGLLGCAMVDDGWRLERDGGLDMRYGRKD
jgi:hypothetical protein